MSERAQPTALVTEISRLFLLLNVCSAKLEATPLADWPVTPATLSHEAMIMLRMRV